MKTNGNSLVTAYDITIGMPNDIERLIRSASNVEKTPYGLVITTYTTGGYEEVFIAMRLIETYQIKKYMKQAAY